MKWLYSLVEGPSGQSLIMNEGPFDSHQFIVDDTNHVLAARGVGSGGFLYLIPESNAGICEAIQCSLQIACIQDRRRGCMGQNALRKFAWTVGSV